MCSICGVFSITDRVEQGTIARMNAAQRHRGPDDDGVWKSDFEDFEVALGNTRLAIIDTSAAGHQPMVDTETGNCITYNGESYNFLDLRSQLGSAPWRSNSDTEVVLRAYRKWGIAAFGKLRGMFALAIWDAQKRELVLARDQFGIKPLYYYISDRLIVFASELRAMLASGLVPRKLSSAGITSYLATGSVEAPLTIVDGIQQLLPGHYLQLRATDSKELKYTVTKFASSHQASLPSNKVEAVARLRAELEESIRAHLVSDVPLGVFLSGGMDSSALVALVSKISEQRPKTFSVVFDEAGFTESQYSRAVAEKFQTDHSEIRLSEERLVEIMPQAVAALDQPSMDGINTYVVSQAVKNAGVTVALSGLGGDELFAGYPSFRRALKLNAVPKASRRVLRVAAGVGQLALNGSVQREKFWQLAASDCTPTDVYRVTRQLFGPRISRIKNGLKSSDVSDDDIVNAISRLELRGYMANTLLRDTDAMSMAHSLEVRVPFVDVKVIEYALSLPGEWKLDRHNSRLPKPLLAAAVADLLPHDFLVRRKMGFTLPFEKWMRGRMRTEISSVLEDGDQFSEVGVAKETVHRVWQRFLRQPQSVGWSRPWSLYVLARWCQLNRVTA